MKSFMKITKIFFILSFLVVNLSTNLIANTCMANELIPSGYDDFYYRIGGGQVVPVPAFQSEDTIPLGADSSMNLNYNCGAFNPMVSITNSLNNIRDSFQNIQQHVIQNATAAIGEFPMYIIARANGPLYNLLNNGLIGAKDDAVFSTKSCQVMVNEVSRGENPYHDWAKLAVGNNWQHHMSLARDSSASNDQDNADINIARRQIEKDNGKYGIPWVHGVNTDRGGIYAGGAGQPSIYVINDTAIAGYNVSLQDKRKYDDITAPVRTDKNAHLVDTWRAPTIAAKWLTHVVGDQEITTYPGGAKSSTPGIGLLPENDVLTKDIQAELIKLISGEEKASLENLKQVSAPHVMINKAVIDVIRKQSPIDRAILVGKISQEAATARLIDKVQLAIQLLEEGRDVPAIYNNDAAQKVIQRAVEKLKRERDDFLFDVKANQALVSNTVTAIMEATRAQQIHNAAIQIGDKSGKDMELGAIKKDKK